MSIRRILIEDLETARGYANDLLSHIDQDLWFRQPDEGQNHIAWNVGHMAVAEYGLCLKRVRGDHPGDSDLVDASYFALFGKGSEPSADSHRYPSPDEILATFHRIHQQVLAEVPKYDDALLDESVEPPHPMFKTKVGAIRFSPKHEMLHVGQIALLRRLFGGASLR